MEARPTRKAQPAVPAPPTVKPERLLERLRDLRDAIARRAYELFESRGQEHGQDINDWLCAEFELTNKVEFELTRTADELSIRAEVPGFTEKEIEVSVLGLQLMVSGRKQPTGKEVEGEKPGKREFFVSVDLPVDVDAEKVSAALEYGVLTIKLPMAPAAEPTRVEVKAE